MIKTAEALLNPDMLLCTFFVLLLVIAYKDPGQSSG